MSERMGVPSGAKIEPVEPSEKEISIEEKYRLVQDFVRRNRAALDEALQSVSAQTERIQELVRIAESGSVSDANELEKLRNEGEILQAEVQQVIAPLLLSPEKIEEIRNIEREYLKRQK